MSILLDIKLKKADKVYHEGDNITGFVEIKANADFKHDGITLTLEGVANLQVSSKNVGILEAFYNSVKPIQLLNLTCEVSGACRLPAGCTQIPFELPLQPRTNRTLYETYHGVYVNISYCLRCEIKRSFLSKDLQKSQQFFVQYKPKVREHKKSVPFTLNPATLGSKSGGAPDFQIKGWLRSAIASLDEPFSGYLVVERCSIPVRSLELQLVRVETCGCAEGYAREATEIQNIQIGDGDVPHNVEIPVYMIFPRLFTCPTLITPNFKIEFEVNIVVVFQNDHLITNNFPIVLVRD